MGTTVVAVVVVVIPELTAVSAAWDNAAYTKQAAVGGVAVFECVCECVLLRAASCAGCLRKIFSHLFSAFPFTL